jgi:hypothetical protein
LLSSLEWESSVLYGTRDRTDVSVVARWSLHIYNRLLCVCEH